MKVQPDKTYIGIIKDVNDPDRKGRCRIQVFGVTHTDAKVLPIEDLPWSNPRLDGATSDSTGAGSYFSPKLNSICRVYFPSGNIYESEWMPSPKMSDGMKALLDNSYDGAQVLLHDQDAQTYLYYTQASGFVFESMGSIINIRNDGSILVQHVDTSSSIELADGTITVVSNAQVEVSANNSVTMNSSLVHANGNTTQLGANPVFSAVMGEPLFALLTAIAQVADLKYPTTPGQTVALVQQMRRQVLSNNVKTSP